MLLPGARRLGAAALALMLASGLVAAQGAGGAAAPKNPPGAKAAPAQPQPPAEKCGRYPFARNAAFAANIKTILSDLPQRGEGSDPAVFFQEMEAHYVKLEEQARAGEIDPLRKLVAMELFASQVRGQPTREMTLKKACFLAKVPEKMRSIIDPLTCAVILLEPERRQGEAARAEAKQMLALAGKLVPANANASSAAKILFDDVSRGLEGCD